MKKPLLTFILTLTLAGGLFAIPLTVEVIKESEKIANTIRAFDKEGTGLGDKATGASPSLNEETPEWRRRIKPQHVESVESAETLAIAFNSRSEEHTSELQSPDHLVCRLLLEKKKYKKNRPASRNDTLANRRHRSQQKTFALRWEQYR